MVRECGGLIVLRVNGMVVRRFFAVAAAVDVATTTLVLVVWVGSPLLSVSDLSDTQSFNLTPLWCGIKKSDL